MRRREFLGLLSLLACKDENMILAQHGIIGSTRQIPDTAFAIIGDSVARGNSTAPGSTPAAGTVFQWNASTGTIVQVGSNDLVEPVNDGAVGSQWPKFGIEYNRLTGRKPCFINTAVGGSGWFNSSDAFSWDTGFGGTCWPNAVTKINNGLAAMQKTRPDGVFIILGVNDAAQNSYALDYALLTSLIDRINTEWETPQIYVGIPEKTVPDTTDGIRLNKMRVFCRNLARDYANVETAGNVKMLQVWDAATYFQGDEFHLTFAGNEKLGELMARQLAMPQSYHRLTRAICGSMFDDLSTARKDLIDTFVTGQITAGNMYLIDDLFLLKNSTYKNAQLDWGFVSSMSSAGSFVADTSIDTNGSSNDIALHPCSNAEDDAEYDSDYILAARIVDCNTAAGTSGCLFGLRERTTTAGIIDLTQSVGSTILWRATSTAAAEVYATDPKFQSNTMYGVARNGGNEYLIKNASEVDSAAVAAVAMNANGIYGLRLGGRNLGGTIDSRLAAEFVYAFGAKYSTLNLTSLYNALEALIAAW